MDSHTGQIIVVIERALGGEQCPDVELCEFLDDKDEPREIVGPDHLREPGRFGGEVSDEDSKGAS